jgi:hypothetical protein
MALTLWQAALAVMGLFVAVGTVAGTIEGAGLSWMLGASERKGSNAHRFDQHSSIQVRPIAGRGLRGIF